MLLATNTHAKESQRRRKGEGALVHTQDFTALDGSHLQLKPALLDLLTDMPGKGWVVV
jgi:hypothetical protein